MPRVTVVIPAYNAQAHIHDALDSICAQSMNDWEVVVVDDGSSDSTYVEVARYAQRHNVRLAHQRNSGPSAARNLGIREAAGEYIAFLDSDDVMRPARLELQATALDADPEVALVYSDLMTFSDSGVIHRSRRAFSQLHEGWVLDKLLLDNFITTSTVMVRRAALIEAGGFDVHRRLSEDFKLWLHIAVRHKVGLVDQPLVNYRRRTGSLSNDKFKTALAALEVIEEFWHEHSDYRLQQPLLHRQSLARHLAVAAAAAGQQGRRDDALRYVLRALRHELFSAEAWKQLTRAMLPALPKRRGG